MSGNCLNCKMEMYTRKKRFNREIGKFILFRQENSNRAEIVKCRESDLNTEQKVVELFTRT